MEFTTLYSQFRQNSIHGRYINNDHIFPLLSQLSHKFKNVDLGHSVEGRVIKGMHFGKGAFKILMWSQMHGNESTTTKALLDFLFLIDSDIEFAKEIESNFSLLIIPILNPDGASAYTRVNANQVDLNRDSVDLSQPESTILRKQLEVFKPELCLNLHDQRTIFGTLGYKLPATVSFLSPSYNEKREINDVRLNAMQLIACINEDLQEFIPNQVGRFDDGFNINCIGDMCTSLQIPTILFEAGHYPNDYLREESRKYIFYSYLSLFDALLSKKYKDKKIEDYLKIPENTKSFFDILYNNFQINVGGLKKSFNFAVQYNEELIENDIKFIAKIAQIDNLENVYGHIEYDMNKFELSENQYHKILDKNSLDLELDINTKIVNGLLIK